MTFKVGDKVVFDRSAKRNEMLAPSKRGSTHTGYEAFYDNEAQGVVTSVGQDFGEGPLITVDFGSYGTSALYADRLKPYVRNFKVGDRVRFTDNPRALPNNSAAFPLLANKPGLTGVVKSVPFPGPHANLYVRFDGESKDTYINSIRLVLAPADAPAPVVTPTRLHSGSDFKVGDRVQFVRDNPEASVGMGPSGDIRRLYDADAHGEVRRSDGVWLDVRFDNETDTRNIYARRFKKEETPMQQTALTQNSSLPARAMTLEAAREQRLRILAADTSLGARDVTSRTRSWSYDGLYGAVEIPSRSLKLYTVAAVDEYIGSLTPIDIVGTKRHSGFYQFRTADGSIIKAPDGVEVWAEREFRDAKGLARHNGRTYRLCIEVKRVVPVYDTATGGLTKL